jgi:hypothetical protein
VNGSVLPVLAVRVRCAVVGAPAEFVGAEVDGVVPPARAPRTSWFGVLGGAVVASGDDSLVPRTAC